jgi:predicted Zn-dependent protease with MMP-like domain
MAQHIIMNYTVSPSIEDLEIIASSVLENLPDELVSHCEELKILIEDLADELAEDELDLDDPFDLLALFQSGSEISPGVQRKSPAGEDTLILYRRAILDMWCETGEDLATIIRQVMIEELGRSFDFSEDDILEMSQRPYTALVA